VAYLLRKDQKLHNFSFIALFKQTQENEDTIGLLQKEKERLEIQIQDLTRQQELQQWQPQQQLSSKQQQQQQQQQVSSQQLPIVQHPNGPTGMGFPSTSTKKDQLSPQVPIHLLL
jgi:chromosome segregation ATPase